MAKKYLSLERLTEYDELIKAKIDAGDASVKSYVDTEVAKKANVSHNHNDVYYTETEIDGKLSTINTSISNITSGSTPVKEAEHATSANSATTATSATKATQDGNGKVISSTYETKTDAANKLAEAKTYTDNAISNIPSNAFIVSITGDDSYGYTADKTFAQLTEAYNNVRPCYMKNSNGNTHQMLPLLQYESDGAIFGVVGLTSYVLSGVAFILTNGNNVIKFSDPNNIEIGDTLTLKTSSKQIVGAINELAVHNHDTAYDTKGSADTALATAKTYADSAATKVKNDLLNGAGAAYDTLKELGELIDDNKDAIDALEDIASGKADATHGHAIADVSGLQSALDGKAASSHGTHVTFDSTNKPKMDGTAAFGTSTKVARADHVHPTDTSRASQTALDSHTGNTTVHITSTERTDWNAAKTHAGSAHAPSDAEKNQNAFSNITVGSTTVSADTTTDTITFVGSNVTITPDATNDKITFAVADGSTSAKGIVQLTNSTSSTSTTTAATPNSVKSAYDLANQAKTAAATAQSTADGKANATHTHAISDITNLQTTLNNAASAISANTDSIDVLQAAINDIQEITSTEIQNLFK